MRLPVIIDADAPEFPDGLDYLWRWFQEISLGLSPNGFAPPVVTWEALRAWQAATDVGVVEPWEAKALVQLGMLRAGVMSEKANEANRRNREPPPGRFGGSTTIPRHPTLALPRRR